MTPMLRQILEDRLSIKCTQTVKRHITHRELATFFIKNTHYVDKVYKEFIRELDVLIELYLEGLK